MLGWGLTSLIVALAAAIVGFGGGDGATAETARRVFEVAIALFAMSALTRMVRGDG